MAKNCLRCGKTAQEGQYCDSCFSELIVKRVKKGFKIDLKKDKKLLVFDKLSESVVKEILKGSRTEIARKALKDFDIAVLDDNVYNNKKLNEYIDKNKISIVILPWTADDEIDKFFIGLFSNKISTKADDKFIKLFKSVTNEELERYSRIKKLKQENISRTNEFISKLAEKYPDIKHSALKGIEEVDEILQKRKER